MGSPIRDCGESWKCLGNELNDFLYVDGKRNLKGGADGILNEFTKDELIAKLISTNDTAWNNYKYIAKEMGWID